MVATAQVQRLAARLVQLRSTVWRILQIDWGLMMKTVLPESLAFESTTQRMRIRCSTKKGSSGLGGVMNDLRHIRRRCLRTWPPVYVFKTTSKRELAAENQQSIRRGWQFSDTDGIPPDHVRRLFSWIVAGTKNHDISARELVQDPFEIAIGRDENEIIRIRVFQDVSVTRTREAISKSTFGIREEVA